MSEMIIKPINILLRILSGGLFFMSAPLKSQPYVDPIQIRGMYAFGNNQTANTSLTHAWIGSDLPVQLNQDTYLLLSPYYEQWKIPVHAMQETPTSLQSLALPIGLILPFRKSKWTMALLPVMRSNSENMFDQNSFQFGGVTLVTYMRKVNQKFRFGLYANSEFFGLFLMPLAGIDWRIDQKNYLFGVLPGRLTFEHQWGKNWFGGATFRAITNSYRLSNGHFLRLDDNQLSLYLDYYPMKRVCLTFEGGYGFLRKIRTGVRHREYLTNINWGNSSFVKLSGSFRIRIPS